MRCRGAGFSAAWALAIVGITLGFGVGCGGGGEGGSEEPAGPPPVEIGSYLHLVVPSVITKDAETDIRLRVVTQMGAPDYDFSGNFRLSTTSDKTRFPENRPLEPQEDGFLQMSGVIFGETGVQHLRGEVPGDTVQALANPFVVVEDPEYRIYWGDLNGRSDLSTGSFSPGLYFWYAKAVGLLDFVALTDYDRHEKRDTTLDEGAFLEIANNVMQELNEPGRFVILPAYQWTSRGYGNRVVFYPELPTELLTAATGTDTPAKLRAALPAGSLLMVPHPSGSAEAPAADPLAVGTGDEELVEICSARGTFEMPGSPRPSSLETAGASVRDLLARGVRVGFTGSGDTDYTTPGNPRAIQAGDAPWHPGLTAVLAKELTREAILDALRRGRCYATTGQRYLLEFTVDGEQMGSRLRVPRGHEAEVYGSLGANAKWLRVEILGPAGPLAHLVPIGADADVVELTARTPPVTEPTWVYLRGIDELGGMVWSSPVYLDPE